MSRTRSVLRLASVVMLLLTSVAPVWALEVTEGTEEGGKEAAVPTPTKVFVCADSGEFSGAHELGFLHAAMEERETLHISHCQSVYLGYLTHANGHRFRALAVTTGIGFISATTCTQTFLALQQERNLVFESMVLIGTSGFSPFIGGWDPINTTTAQRQLERQRSTAPAADTHPGSPARKFQTAAERERDAAQDLLRAAQRGVPTTRSIAADSEGAEDDDVVRVNGIAANVNWERVATQEQIHPDGCAPMRVRATTSPSTSILKYNQRVSIGSICVTRASFLQETGFCKETLNSNQCSRPSCSRFENVLNRRNVHVARGAGSQQLVADILAASSGKAFPAVPAAVRDGMRTFWARNEAAAKEDGVEEEDLSPTFVTCAESTMNSIFVGAERDYLCRERTAYVLNAQHRALHKEEAGESQPYTADNVVCVQAMEAFGFLEAASRHPSIPVAVIRTASNYDMYPQQKLYVSKRHVNAQLTDVDEDDSNPMLPYVWRQNVGYVSAEEYDAFVHASFHYSVQTATFVVSNFFLGSRDLSQLTSTH